MVMLDGSLGRSRWIVREKVVLTEAFGIRLIDYLLA